MITTATWVPRGFAAPFPTKYKFDEEEFERIAELAKLQLEDAKEDLEEAQEAEGKADEPVDAEPAEATKATKSSRGAAERDNEMDDEFVPSFPASTPSTPQRVHVADNAWQSGYRRRLERIRS